MNKREMMHQMALHRQDMQFKRNAHIRQKIYAAIFVVLVIVAWAWLVAYDPVHIWYGFLAVPAILFGVWLMITKTNYPWELKEGRENE